MELPRSRKALAQAQRAHDEMVAAWDSDDDFDYRFVICMALLMRVGTTIEDEAKGNQQKGFPEWWKQAADSQPLFTYLREVRNQELKNAKAETAAQRFPRSGSMPRVSRAVRPRPRSRLIGPGQTVIQPASIEDADSAPVSHVVIGPRISRIFGHGEFAGHDALPSVSQYVDWLENTLLPGAEAHTAPNASRPHP